MNILDQLKNDIDNLAVRDQTSAIEVLKLIHAIILRNSCRSGDLKAIKRYLKDMLQERPQIPDTLSVFKLKEKVLSNKRFPVEYTDEIATYTWKLLPKLSSFASINELDNFLSYILHVKFNGSVNDSKFNRGFNDREKLVQIYKNMFTMCRDPEKKVWLENLARHTFAAATKNDISKLAESTDTDESTLPKKQNKKRL